MNINDIFKRPVLTEKSLRLARQGWYTFEVNKEATKKDIAGAVKELFNVDPIKVRTMVVEGKTRRVGRARREVKSTSWKKTMIKIKKEQKIDLFDVA